MQIASVVGQVVATRKHATLEGAKLLLVQPQTPEGEPRGPVLLSIDAVGAGVGEDVFFVRGAEASFPFAPRTVPTDASIVGIVDSVYT